MKTRRSLAPLLIAALLAVACAVTKAPQIAPATARDLNIGFGLTQANSDYTTFFKDVGDASRSGTLSAGQVATLNSVGHKAKLILEDANKTYKTYVQTKDLTLVDKINGFVIEAEGIIAQLIAQRAAMLAQNAKGTP